MGKGIGGLLRKRMRLLKILKHMWMYIKWKKRKRRKSLIRLKQMMNMYNIKRKRNIETIHIYKDNKKEINIDMLHSA